MSDSRGLRLFTVPGRPELRPLLLFVVGAALVTNLAYVVSLWAVDRPESGFSPLWDGWMFHVAAILPAGVTAIRAITDRRMPGAWWWMTAGIVLNCVASLVWTYRDQNLDPIPFPGWSDLPYLGSYAAFVVGLTLITQSAAAATRSTRLDGAVVGLCAGAVAVALWFEPVLAQSGSTAEVLVGLAYPLFDVVILIVVVAGLAPSGYRPNPAALGFMAGAVVFAAGDVIYLNQNANDTYLPATWLEATWVVGILLFALSAWLPARRRDHVGSEAPGSLSGLPVASAAVALVVIAGGLFDRVPALAAWLAMGAVAASVVRVTYTVRELREANENFRQARTDELTLLANRRGFAETLEDRLGRASEPTSVLMIDLDGFKEVNDSLGHSAGDLLLTVVGERFTRALSKGSSIARLGGDEFGIFLPGGEEAAVLQARHLLEVLGDPISLDGLRVRIGASIGVAVAPQHGSTRAALLRAADVAMYEAKRAQRGIAVYSEHQDPHSRERLALIEDLRRAIEQRAFTMHYQPTVDVATGRVIGMEALIRWEHPTRGMLAPDQFIPLAERVGLIPAITRAVLEQSIAHIAQMRRAGHDLRLSVNISGRDLIDEELPQVVRALLDANGVPPHLLTLEITETALASDQVRADRTLRALRAEGMRVSIDDFGVGYSSLAQLLQLPVDELKLDRSFLVNIAEDIRAEAVLRASVELGRSLGLSIVAEGVETIAAFDMIAHHNVDVAQGYLFCKPLAPAPFTQFVERAQHDDETPTSQPSASTPPAGSSIVRPDPAPVLPEVPGTTRG